MRAIVLSGGGARGAYEIGFWKALKKLHIKYDLVTGTSVGALNGALMVQKSYFKALYLWYNLSYDDIFEISNKYSEEDIMSFYKDSVLKGGVDVSNLEKTVRKCLKPKRFFKSSVDFGLITVKFPSFKHVEITKNKLNKENLDDFLVASSSCFPAFKVKKIKNQGYIDGGFYDNMPINLAIKMGATEVIAVDLDAIGINRKPKSDIDITLISPRNKIDSFLKFEKESTRRAIRLGYNDTMKTYNRLDGNKYTYKLGHLNKNLDRYKNKYLDNVNKLINDKKINSKILENITFRKLYKNDKSCNKEIIDSIEKLGYLLEVDDSYIYNIKKYNKIIIKKFKNIDYDLKDIEKNIKNNMIKTYMNNKIMVKYLYELMKNKQYSKLKKLCLLFPDEFLMSVYILTIEGA